MVRVMLEERARGSFVVSLDGDLDMATAPMLADAVERVMADAPVAELQVDLAQVRFLDSSGVRALLQARRAAAERGAAFMVSRPGELVAQVLRIAAVDHLLGVEPPSPSPGNLPGSRHPER
jgi:anti-anti-sigma factor